MNGIDAIFPGKTIGVLGGGQLGRMLAQAATRMGYRMHIFELQADSPASAVAHETINAPYEDLAALTTFARACDVVTYESENVPAVRIKAIEKVTRLRPHWSVLETTQNRFREKRWLRDHGFPHARFGEVAADGDLRTGFDQVGLPCVVKTADFGYDGKGQMKIFSAEEIPAAVRRFTGQPVVVEQFVDFSGEVSAVVTRSPSGEMRVFPVAENLHASHILDFSIVPARVPLAVAVRVEQLARAVAEKIGLVGVMCVEFFVPKTGDVLVNELAPRPHNSGHYTLDACMVSQFEQQVRAICGLPLGSAELLSPVVMANIFGDVWKRRDGKVVAEPAWNALLAEPAVRLHLYGKSEPLIGRKMGHFSATALDVNTALELAQRCRAKL